MGFLKCAGVVEEDVWRSNFVSVDEKLTKNYGKNRSKYENTSRKEITTYPR